MDHLLLLSAMCNQGAGLKAEQLAQEDALTWKAGVPHGSLIAKHQPHARFLLLSKKALGFSPRDGLYEQATGTQNPQQRFCWETSCLIWVDPVHLFSVRITVPA